jgi:hypothetical protein
MNASSRTIRPLAPAEVATLVDWAAGEGWNPGHGDAPAFHAADPDGFLGAFVDGAFVAGISAVAYGDAFGFIGLYICRPDMRGKGHGRAVWEAGLARLGNRTIGLDGVPEQQANYARMGFVGQYRTVRMSGRFALPPEPGTDIRLLTRDRLVGIEPYDLLCFPAPRTAFLAEWLDDPRVALAIVRNDRLAGYGVSRRCREGCKIGPLFADDFAAARALFATLAEASGSDVHIDVPEPRGEFLELLRAGGLTPGFETARMYRGGNAPALSERVFGITTLELG